MTRAYHWIALAVLISACDTETDAQLAARWDREEWNGRCRDEATLVATTSGSPSSTRCPNRLHRMRVQVASSPSNEEFGAVVFCECTRDGAKP